MHCLVCLWLLLILFGAFNVHCNVLYQIPQDSPTTGLLNSKPSVDARNSDTAADTIYEVNTETAELMDSNNTRDFRKLFEVDIRLHSRSHAVVFGADPRIQFGAHASANALWPGGIVPYTLSSSISSEPGGITFAAIQKAIAEFKSKSCIRFKPRTSETDYIHFFKETGCWSLVGRVGGKQQISLASGCEHKGVIMHEMMHALGFWHEQSRPDRNSFIRIITNNIMDGREDQFKMYGKREIDSLGFKYDYSSIMHYGKKAFSRNGQDTIAVLDPTYKGTLGQRNGLSLVDAQQLNKLYKCNVSPVDGRWGVWSEWMTCSKPCGGGQQIRTRSCDNPEPSSGGKPCSGSNMEQRPCNSQACSNGCDFNSGLCLWKNDAGNDFDWTRTNVITPSGGTGPTITGRGVQDYYLFIETSTPRQQGEKASLSSAAIPSSSLDRCLYFSYSMNGATIGRLMVEMQDSVTSNPLWSLSGDQGKSWKNGRMPIPKNKGPFKIIFTGIRGSSYTGDIAIDNVAIVTSTCAVTPSNAAPTVATSRPVVRTTPKAQITSSTMKPASAIDCSFETNCGWVNAVGDSFNWQIWQKRTPTANTGPTADHTTGTGNYVYIETSNPRITGDFARLKSPPLTTTKTSCLEFYYTMFGSSIGKLKVFVVLQRGTEIPLWELKSQQGRNWQKAMVPLPANSNFRVVIEGTVGSSVFGDIAVDDIKWSNQGASCSLYPSHAKFTKITVTTAAPATTSIPFGSILVEVRSEGCDDPAVRQRTLRKLGITSSSGRVRRSPLGFFDHLKKKAKSVAKKLKKAYGKLTKKLLGDDDDDDDYSTGKSRNAAVQNDCSLAVASIKVNGREYANHKKGHTIVAINAKTGQPFRRGNFNTDVSSLAGQSIAQMIKAFPDETIIAIATESSASASTLGAVELRGIGAAAPYYPATRGSWAFIGYKGSRSVNWIQQESKAKGRGPAQVTAVIPITSPPVSVKKLEVSTYTKFDGTTYVPIAVKYSSIFDLGETDFTFISWIKTAQDGTIVSKVGTSDTYDAKAKFIYLERGLIKLKLTDSFVATGSKIVTDDRWHMVAVVVKAAAAPNSVSLFVDNNLQFSKTFDATPDPPGYLARVGYGVRYYPSPSIFIGEMKSVAYFDQALTVKEIGDEFQKGPSATG